MPDELQWTEVSRLVRNMGHERWISSRLAEWRMEADNMTQAELAKRMTDLGYPMNKTSIWKIENPEKKAGRRSISIGEAIGFARVFGKSLDELLLPPAALDEVRGWREYLECAAELEKVRTAWKAYELKLRALQQLIERNDHLRARINDARSTVEATFREERKRWFDHAGASFGLASADEFADAQEPTPELAVLRDATSGHAVNPFGWAESRLLPGTRTGSRQTDA